MFYRIVRAIVLSLCKLLFRVRVIGGDHVPSSGVYIVAPSHRSILDVPFTAFVTRRRVRFMAKKELFSTRFGRWLFTSLGGISVDRQGADRAALRASQTALEEGEPLAIFPEGTRRNGSTLGELYNGAAYLALKLGIPIVPIGIGGSEEILASGKILPRLRKVVVVVGEPIVPTAAEGVRRRSAVHGSTEELRVRLQALFDEARTAAGASGTPLVGERGERA